MMKAVELFCGIGVNASAYKAVGIDLVGAVDNHKRSVELFNQQSHLTASVGVVGDVGEYVAPKCDLISGGPV